MSENNNAVHTELKSKDDFENAITQLRTEHTAPKTSRSTEAAPVSSNKP